MSKSLGNFVTIAQVLERNDGEALRYFLCGAHYRGPVSFDLEKLPDGASSSRGSTRPSGASSTST
jgi:cysteinyl-tRNA synthetase